MMISIATEYGKRGNPKDGFTKLFGLTITDRLQPYRLRSSFTEPRSLTIKLKKLYCDESEDFIGKDQASLDVFCDGNFIARLEKKMNDGDSYTLNKVFNANNAIALHLFDNDTGNEDDLLGNHKFTKNNINGVESKTLYFKKDGAEYRLTVDISTSLKVADTPESLIQAFEKRTSVSKWKYVTRKQIADQLRVRVSKPEEINQGPTMFCGPTAVLYEMAKAMPLRYVKMVIDIYEKHEWKAITKTFKPPTELFDQKIPIKTYDNGNTNTIPEADWIALVAIRETINKIFSLDEANDTQSSLQGGAMCYEVSAVLVELLGYRNPDIFATSQFARLGLKLPEYSLADILIPGAIVLTLTDWAFKKITGDAVDGLLLAKNYLNKGGFAVMQINTKLINEKSADQSFSDKITPTTSSHFVSLYSSTSVIIANNRVKAEVFTWGRTENVDHKTNDYERYTFAYVFAKPSAAI